MMTRDHLHVIGAEPAGLMLAYQVYWLKFKSEFTVKICLMVLQIFFLQKMNR